MKTYDWNNVDKVDLKKGLRYSYKNISLNLFGKKASELTCIERRRVLDWTLNDMIAIGYITAYGKDFKDFFKETFIKEIKECKK